MWSLNGWLHICAQEPTVRWFRRIWGVIMNYCYLYDKRPGTVGSRTLIPYQFKGAVSYRFSQGPLTLMCNNSELKADINFLFFLLRRQTSYVYSWLQKIMIQL